jgi:hypothetical protein
VRFPELLCVGCPLDELGGFQGELVPRHRPVAKGVNELITELVTKLYDTFMRSAAVRAGVAAIFDQ